MTNRPASFGTAIVWCITFIVVEHVVMAISCIYYAQHIVETDIAINNTRRWFEELALIAVDNFAVDHEQYPSDVDELLSYFPDDASTGYGEYRSAFERGIDPWGTPVEMYVDAAKRKLILYSLGPDRATSEDDICGVYHLYLLTNETE